MEISRVLQTIYRQLSFKAQKQALDRKYQLPINRKLCTFKYRSISNCDEFSRKDAPEDYAKQPRSNLWCGYCSNCRRLRHFIYQLLINRKLCHFKLQSESWLAKLIEKRDGSNTVKYAITYTIIRPQKVSKFENNFSEKNHC